MLGIGRDVPGVDQALRRFPGDDRTPDLLGAVLPNFEDAPADASLDDDASDLILADRELALRPPHRNFIGVEAESVGLAARDDKRLYDGRQRRCINVGLHRFVLLRRAPDLGAPFSA